MLQIRYNGSTFMVWDVGGQDKLRPLWRSYTRCTDGIIFVVDSSREESLEEAKLELQNICKASPNGVAPGRVTNSLYFLFPTSFNQARLRLTASGSLSMSCRFKKQLRGPCFSMHGAKLSTPCTLWLCEQLSCFNFHARPFR